MNVMKFYYKDGFAALTHKIYRPLGRMLMLFCAVMAGEFEDTVTIYGIFMWRGFKKALKRFERALKKLVKSFEESS